MPRTIAPSHTAASSLVADLNGLLQRFVADVAAATRTAAVGEAARALGGAPAAVPRKAAGPARKAKEVAPDARLGAAVVSHLLAHSARAPRELAKALRVPREEIGESLRHLLADGLVVAKGHGRGRTYSAAPGATGRR
jgi:hypothetical protein